MVMLSESGLKLFGSATLVELSCEAVRKYGMLDKRMSELQMEAGNALKSDTFGNGKLDAQELRVSWSVSREAGLSGILASWILAAVRKMVDWHLKLELLGNDLYIDTMREPANFLMRELTRVR